MTFLFKRYDKPEICSDADDFIEARDGDWVCAQDAINREAVNAAKIATLEAQIRKMKVFTCTEFKGHYPVGVSAVVVAKDAEDAAILLSGYLCGIGLGVQRIEANQMVELNTQKMSVTVLNDGDY